MLRMRATMYHPCLGLFRICEVIDPAFEAFRSNIAEVPCAQVGEEAYMGII